MKTEAASGQSLISLLQQRISEMKERASALQGQLDSIKVDCAAYENALAVEKRRAGIADGDNGCPDKWLLFEQFCVDRVNQGFTRPDIARFFQDRRVPVGKNFPYYAVDKYTDRLEEKKGRLYWLTSANGTTNA